MSEIRSFEDFTAWQKARKLTADVYSATRCGAFAKDFGLSNQIQRASVSIMSNIAEDMNAPTAKSFLISFASRKPPVEKCAHNFTLRWMPVILTRRLSLN